MKKEKGTGDGTRMSRGVGGEREKKGGEMRKNLDDRHERKQSDREREGDR